MSKNIVAKRDLLLKTLDKTPAEMPKNFRSATSACDLTGAEKDNTVNEMVELRAELALMKLNSWLQAWQLPRCSAQPARRLGGGSGCNSGWLHRRPRESTKAHT